MLSIKYPDFIDNSQVNVPGILNNSVTGEIIKKKVTFVDEEANLIQNNKLINEKNNDLINLNEKPVNILLEKKFEENIDPILKKENEEIYSILDKKCQEIEPFLNRDWKLLEEKDGFKSYYFDEASGLRSIKSHVIINKNIKVIAAYLEDLSKRANYDKNFDHGKVLRIVDTNHNISYLKFKGKIMISPRDFIVIARKQIVFIKIFIFFYS